MAIQIKDYINQYGIEEQYWRILSMNINLQYKYVDITLGGYATQEARDNGAEPMNTKKVRAKWDEEEFDAFFSPNAPRMLSADVGMNIYNIAYDYIKYKDKMFENSIDV